MVIPFTIRTVNAITDMGKLGGAAGSHRFLCDDENDYIVKFVNPQNKIAINELVAGSIATELGLPTPGKVLVNISQEVIEDSEGLADQLIPLNPHIGSNVLPKEGEDFKKFSEGKLNEMKLTNVESLYGIVAFDNWIHNTDRNNKGNNMITFLPRTKIRLVMIDFSHCFGGDNWTGDILNQIRDQDAPISNFPYIQRQLTDNSKFEQWIQKIENFQNERIDDILNCIPNTWNFDEAEKTILANFLQTRRGMVRRIITERGG